MPMVFLRSIALTVGLWLPSSLRRCCSLAVAFDIQKQSFGLFFRKRFDIGKYLRQQTSVIPFGDLFQYSISQLFNSGQFKDRSEGEFNSQSAMDSGHGFHGQQRIASQCEEVVARPYLFDLQYLSPYPRQSFFYGVSWLHIQPRL